MGNQQDPLYVIQKQYLTKEEGWSEWVDAFTFGEDLIATNDFFDVLQSCYQSAYSPEELRMVPHRWRVQDITTQETIECSGDVNFISLSEFGSYDVASVGELPYWIDGESRNIQENIRQYLNLLKDAEAGEEDYDNE